MSPTDNSAGQACDKAAEMNAVYQWRHNGVRSVLFMSQARELWGSTAAQAHVWAQIAIAMVADRGSGTWIGLAIGST